VAHPWPPLRFGAVAYATRTSIGTENTVVHVGLRPRATTRYPVQCASTLYFRGSNSGRLRPSSPFMLRGDVVMATSIQPWLVPAPRRGRRTTRSATRSAAPSAKLNARGQRRVEHFFGQACRTLGLEKVA